MVFYRKYRPQVIGDLDSASLRDTLYAILLKRLEHENELPHAFLFTGPKGLGKTSTARITAKILNCTEVLVDKKPPELCNNKCVACRSITEGTNLDVLEIDGASNRGIDEIRDLRDKVRLSPSSSNQKVYIIDEVHMLTNEAFNALLKTIEEPPSHVAFIFCTTEPHKIPETILSRCFHVAFNIATKDELKQSFKRIVEGEKMNVDEDALDFIADVSDGSFRDGAKVLEELSLLSGKNQIDKAFVEKMYNLSGISSSVREFISYFATFDTKQALLLIKSLVKQGTDLRYFVQKLISELHKMVLVQVGVEDRTSLPMDYSLLSINEIKQLVPILNKAYLEMKYAAVVELPLELAVIEWSSKHTEQRKDEVELHGITSQIHVSKPVQKDNIVLATLIEKTKSHSQPVAGVLRSCTIKQYDGKTLVLEAKHKFHKERLDDIRAMEVLQKVCRDLAGNDVAISVLLADK